MVLGFMLWQVVHYRWCEEKVSPTCWIELNISHVGRKIHFLTVFFYKETLTKIRPDQGIKG